MTCRKTHHVSCVSISMTFQEDKKMTWINNVPEPRVKQNHALDLGRARDAQGMLEFVQQEQDVTIDHLMEEVMSWYLRRKKFDFPLYGETEKVQFTLPHSMDEDLQEIVKKRQIHDADASMKHVIEHALEMYLNSHGALPKAWREEKKKRKKQHTLKEKDTPSVDVQRDLSNKPKTSTTSVTSPYAKISTLSAPIQNTYDVAPSEPEPRKAEGSSQEKI